MNLEIERRTDGFSAEKPKEAGPESGFERRRKSDSMGFPGDLLYFGKPWVSKE